MRNDRRKGFNMNKMEFKSKRGCTYVRISKKRACKLFTQKHTIVIAPCNMRLFTEWGGWSVLQSDTENNPVTFERCVNLFTYYNCNSELGKYPSFYVGKTINENN